MDEPLEKFFAHCSELAEVGFPPLSEEEVLAIRMFWHWLLEENPVYAAAIKGAYRAAAKARGE